MKQKLLILLAAVMAAVSTYAYDFKVDGIWYNVLPSTEVEVTYGNEKYSDNIIIPNNVSYGGTSYSVTSIGNGAFQSCSALASVTIPNSVTSIGRSAFYCCTGLASVTIPNSVTSIGGYAFSGCTDLASVTISNSLTSIGEYVFQGCSGLTSVTIPNSVTSIGERAFFNCSSLTSVDIPNSVTAIGYCAFQSCSYLDSVTLPNSVISIADGAFAGTELFENGSNWVNGVLYIGSHLIKAKKVFATGDYVIKAGTLTLAANAFEDCSYLASVTIPNSVTAIESQAFYGCSGLTSVDIPNSVTAIKGEAFSGCSGLTSVSIPNSVTFIGGSAFSGCSDLTSVTVNNSDPSNISSEYVFESPTLESATLYVPAGSKELYAQAYTWKGFRSIVEFQPDSTPDEFNLVDTQPYTEMYSRQSVDINYTRTFEANVWHPLYVPFNMSYDEWSEYGSVAELSCVHAYDDGRTTIEFVTVNGGELLPNVPYVFLPNTDVEITFSCTHKTLKAAPAENTKYIMCSSPRYTFKIYGNYQPIDGNTLATYGDSEFKGAYVMTEGNKFQHCSPTATLNPYRFYITREKSANGYWGAPSRLNAPGAEEDDEDVIYFMVDGKVCGIADIVIGAEDNSAIYDLMGREVKNPTNGIYIQDGKKVRIY